MCSGRIPERCRKYRSRTGREEWLNVEKGGVGDIMYVQRDFIISSEFIPYTGYSIIKATSSDTRKIRAKFCQ